MKSDEVKNSKKTSLKNDQVKKKSINNNINKTSQRENVDNSNVQKYKLEKTKKKFSIKKVRDEIIKFVKKYSIVLLILIIILLLIFIILIMNWLFGNSRMKKYEKYEYKMSMYGFSNLYLNGSVKTDEQVTKIEALKLAIATMLNTTDISGIARNYDGYEGQTWVRYAEFFGIVDYNEINEENKDEIVKYVDMVRYFQNAKTAYTDTKISSSNAIVLKDAAQYDASVQVLFSDLVENKVIEIENSNIDGQQLVFKGLANEMVVNYLDRFSLISSDKARLRNTELPNSSSSYPYILFDIPQKAYDYNFIKTNETDFKEPREVYKDLKLVYNLIIDDIENFYTNLYSIDYTNLKADSIYAYIERFSGTVPVLDELKDYCSFAIKNKIKTEAKVNLIEPCIYFDGQRYRARVEVKLNIISSDADENILFGDSLLGKVTYGKKEYIVYFDTQFDYSNSLGKIYVRYPYGMVNDALNKTDLDVKVEIKN